MTDARSVELFRYFDLLGVIVPRATDRRHEPQAVLRDGDEALLGCRRCAALGYADAASGPLIGGRLFDENCPYEGPPGATPLTDLWGRC